MMVLQKNLRPIPCRIDRAIGTLRYATVSMTSPQVIFTICRHSTAYRYHIIKSLIARLPLLVLCSFLEERIHQQLTLSSINVLSFFSFENSTHNRLSHSLPSSADDVKGKIQSRISKLFFIDFRFIILTQLCSYLLNIVSHPSNFSDNIAANPSI